MCCCVVDYDYKSFEVFVNDILIQGDLKFKFSTTTTTTTKKKNSEIKHFRMFMISFIE